MALTIGIKSFRFCAIYATRPFGLTSSPWSKYYRGFFHGQRMEYKVSFSLLFFNARRPVGIQDIFYDCTLLKFACFEDPGPKYEGIIKGARRNGNTKFLHGRSSSAQFSAPEERCGQHTRGSANGSIQ